MEGSWSVWHPWATCSGTCDSDATRNRTRSFHNGTIPCSGNATDAESCSGIVYCHRIKQYCKDECQRKTCLSLVEGSWSTWDHWSACHGTCDNDAKHNRSRSFVGGNMPCSGNATEERSCTGTNSTVEQIFCHD